MPFAVPAELSSISSQEVLLTILEVSATAIALLRPVGEQPQEEATHFAWQYLNPAAQQLLQLPAHPPEGSTGMLTQVAFQAVCQTVWAKGKAEVYYSEQVAASGPLAIEVAMRRSGGLLVASFSATPQLAQSMPQQPADAKQQEARITNEPLQQQLFQVFQQAPAMICLFEGPSHIFQFVNPSYQALVGNRHIIGRPIAEAMPELVGQPIFELLDRVYQTGETFAAQEMLVQLDHENEGRHELEKRYYNFIYQARRNQDNTVEGIFVFAYDVTPQVLARQQVVQQEARTSQLNEDLAAANRELQYAGQVAQSYTLELQQAHLQQQQLNQELEARVLERTRLLADSLEETERQRQQVQLHEQQLLQILGQVPASVATLEGPEHRYSFFNARYQQLTGNRARLGLTVAEALPEVAAQGFTRLLDNVYATGQAFVGTETPLILLNPDSGEPEQRYIDLVYQPLRSPQGDIQGILAFVLDTTEKVLARQRAEAAQREVAASVQQLASQRDTFYQIFEQTPAAICILRGPEHRLDYFNPAYQALFPERLQKGRTIAELQPEAIAHGFLALLDAVYHTGETYFGYERLLVIEQANGAAAQPTYFDFTYQQFQEAGQPAGISVFATNVTERVVARQQREAQQQQLQRVFEQAPVAIGVFAGPEYIVEVCNPGLQTIWGRTQAQVLGKPLLEVVPEFRDQGVEQLMDEVMRTGQPFTAQEMPLQLQHQGQLLTVYVNFVYHPLRDAQGQISAIAVVATDISEQVRARQTSEATARRLQLITDALPVLISYLDKEERYRFVNHGYEAWFNRAPEDTLGRTVREVIGEQAYPSVAEYLRRALAGERLDFDARMPYREGFTKYIHTSYVPDVQDGEVRGIYTLVNDITAQVEAQREAEWQGRLLETLFMEAPAPIAILDGPDWTFQLVNPAYQRIFPGRELLGKPVLEALPELTDTTIIDSLTQVYHTGETVVFQELPLHLARYANGPLEELYFTFTYQARRNSEGLVDGVLVFAYEVTDQVHARRVVEKSEQYLRMMADNVPAMIWLTEASGSCIYINQQWYEYTGQTEAEGLGRGWLDAVHPEDAGAARTTFLDASARFAPFSLLYRLRRHDGRYRWGLATGFPRFGHQGRFEGYVGTVFDIHEQKQAEQALQRLTSKLRIARDQAENLNTELQASNEQLRRTNVDLDNFIYTASHDLKAPITNIEGLVNLLQNQIPAGNPLMPEIQPLLSMMRESVTRFQRTLEHLSDVTKLQKEYDQPVTQVNLAAMLQDVQLDLRPLIEEAGAHISIDVTACPSISFAAKNLRSVVYNLLSNALKYRSSERPVQVQVRCYQEPGFSVLSVQDNGLGLEARQQQELFTMFRRFHPGIEGSGIGLYMVKKVVENMGGKLMVASVPGVGSTFSAYFRR
ncbi:PAS domain-containing protein [Hymenobacter rigui]|uniref:histidine kinase n=1 Tax=Hymenobacter rigui TaxID=334424 RepID=A0A3R9PEH9_9BACT|nr:PAS domain-containing protein [Hymenobacter rigui]RSK50358.1 PAS domain S-box protein [Hymenobacter rigui]